MFKLDGFPGNLALLADVGLSYDNPIVIDDEVISVSSDDSEDTWVIFGTDDEEFFQDDFNYSDGESLPPVDSDDLEYSDE